MAGKKKKEASEEITDVLDLEELEHEIENETETELDIDPEATTQKVSLMSARPASERKKSEKAGKTKSKKKKKSTRKAKKSEDTEEIEIEAKEESTEELFLEEAASENKKKNKPKKKAQENKSEESDKKEAAAEKKEQKAAEKKTEKKASKKDKDPLHERAAMVSVAVQQSMDSMVKQWNSVKQSSDSVTQNFERLNGLMREFPDSYQKLLDDIDKKQSGNSPAPKNSYRAALAVSMFALVLSVMSLIFSQSVRRATFVPTASTKTQQRAEAIARASKNRRSDLYKYTKQVKRKRATRRTKKRR